MAGRTQFALVLACLVVLSSFCLRGQVLPNVSYDRLLNAAKEPQDWLTYSGTYFSQRYSLLDQINLSNVKNLEQKWVYQGQVIGNWQATPLVVEGIMYVTQRPNDVVAIDARTGRPLWNVQVADYKLSYSLTLAPLVVKDKVIVGVGGGDRAIRGFMAAYDAQTGKEAWRFYTIPGPGEPGHDTWSGDGWKYGSASVWVTGSYDPDL